MASRPLPLGRISEVDPREEALPRWVQAKLADARRQVAEAWETAEAMTLATDPEGSDTIVRRMVGVRRGGEIGLGKRPTVQFRVNPPDGRDRIDTYDYVEAVLMENGDGLTIRGGTCLVIETISSNHFSVYVRNGNLKPYRRG